MLLPAEPERRIDGRVVRQRALIEVAITSVEDALAAQAGGADRLELNAAISLGGLTPSLGTLIEVKAAVSLPVMVMIRPRPGGFAYSDTEFKVMQRDADLALQHGADGIVFGILIPDGRVDVDRCRNLVRQVGAREAIFHRAFDVTTDPIESLEQLVEMGFRRVMTSGQEETAFNGVELIAELIRRAAKRIEIIPAGGINRFTVGDIVSRTGCDQIHASLRTKRDDRSVAGRPQVSFGSHVRIPEHQYDVTSPDGIAEVRKQLSS
jgi:copper homeostasis protein